MGLSLNWITNFPALTVLHPCSCWHRLAWANSLDAKLSLEALIELTVTIDHELFTCNGNVAKTDDTATVIVAFAVAFAVAGWCSLRCHQIPFEHHCARILVFISIF